MVLSTGSFSRDIGPKQLLDAFFATVGCRLEPAGRATRFPAIMGDFFEGVLTAERAPGALAELAEIERGLRALPAAKTVDGTGVPHGSNAYECLAGPDGRPLLEHIRAAVEESVRNRKLLQVSISRGNRIQFQLALAMALLGAAWIFLGRSFFGNWILVSHFQDPNDHSGLYIWSMGFVFVAMGAAFMLAAVFPRLRIWFQHRNWATLIVAFALVAALIYFGSLPR